MKETHNITGEYGKFAGKDELLSAYNALESEFTKRCQLIKELQARLDALDAQAAAPSGAGASENAFNVSATNAEGVRSSACETPEVVDLDRALELVTENIADCAEYLAALPEVESACIAAYKQRLLALAKVPAVAGVSVMTPVKRPKNLADAKRLADEILI